MIGDVETFVTQEALTYATQPKDQGEVRRQRQRVTRAYAALSRNGDFRVLLEDLVVSVLLRKCETPQDEGERRLVLKLFETLRLAQQVEQQQETRDA